MGPAVSFALVLLGSSSFCCYLAGPFLLTFMSEEELLELILSRTKKPAKEYKLLRSTLYPGKRVPKKRKIKRKKNATKIL